MKPMISVGIPTYNRVDWLKCALDSVLNQIYSNIEIIVYDNASTDGTEFLMKYYCSKYDNIRYYKNDYNVGPWNNYRKLTDKMMGKYIFFLPDDDYLLDGLFFSEAVEIMELEDNVLMVGGMVEEYKVHTGEIINKNYKYNKIIRGKEFFLNYRNYGYEVTWGFFRLMRKDIFENVGGIDSSSFIDVTLDFKFSLKGDVGFVNRLIGGMRIREEPYPVNMFLKSDILKNNHREIEKIFNLAKLEKDFYHEDLALWKEKWIDKFTFMGSVDLFDSEVSDSIIYIKKRYPKIYRKILIMKFITILKRNKLIKFFKKKLIYFKNKY